MANCIRQKFHNPHCLGRKISQEIYTVSSCRSAVWQQQELSSKCCRQLSIKRAEECFNGSRQEEQQRATDTAAFMCRWVHHTPRCTSSKTICFASVCQVQQKNCTTIAYDNNIDSSSMLLTEQQHWMTITTTI